MFKNMMIDLMAMISRELNQEGIPRRNINIVKE